MDRVTYLARLLDRRPDLYSATNVQPWLLELRDRTTKLLAKQAIPSTRDEAWRFTDLTSLVQTEFIPSVAESLTLSEIAPEILPEVSTRLVFVNGVYASDLSTIPSLPEGMVVGSLMQLLDTSACSLPLHAYLATLPGFDEVFTALNTASFRDSAVVFVPKNVELSGPIHLLFVSTTGQEQEAAIAHSRCLVMAEPNSQLTLVEEFVGYGEGVYCNTSVTELWLGENAQINHTRVQREGAAAFHIGKTAVSQARDSRYLNHSISLGAALSRHNLEIYQTGEQTQTILNGLTSIQGKQVSDTHSAIALTKPYGSSRQLHKCIVDDRAHAIFNGRVQVPQAAQLTDAGQLNRNLLLSSKARVDTKPQLEIVADNVKCTHGATVGQLDADEVFYLQSRGIDADSARKLLVYAFAYEILNHIPVESLKQKLVRSMAFQT